MSKNLVQIYARIGARRDVMRTNAANARRKAREQAKSYDHKRYDGSQAASEES